jgi:hypothetical protein
LSQPGIVRFVFSAPLPGSSVKISGLAAPEPFCTAVIVFLHFSLGNFSFMARLSLVFRIKSDGYADLTRRHPARSPHEWPSPERVRRRFRRNAGPAASPEGGAGAAGAG